ncbi:MAG: ABC transporter ATP-binding protein [Candidatus Zixiibacteriota bacterium]|nr:MAG: ABC transporter ATP-binding protein [candidate division Zixibacteria bacterium]
MNDRAVVVEDLSRHFGRFRAVDGISLTVDRGEIFGFLGANGAGKTTTIRMLCGLLAPTAGKGSVAGFDIYRQAESIKKSIGYMSQKFSLYPDLTGRENLNFYGAAYGLDRKQIRVRTQQLTERLNLQDFVDRLSSSLPVGWRQRLALGVSLLHEPKILFLDEPTSGVDPVFRRKFWQLLYELAEEGVTIFVTTHYMDEAEYCGRISIMHQGKIVELGRPFELVERYRAANLEDLFVDLIRNRDNVNAPA